MRYDEAFKHKIDNENKIDSFIAVLDSPRSVAGHNVLAIIISPLSEWKRVRHETLLYRGDNKKALESLNLLKEDLQVLIIAENNEGEEYAQPLLEYINDIEKL